MTIENARELVAGAIADIGANETIMGCDFVDTVWPISSNDDVVVHRDCPMTSWDGKYLLVGMYSLSLAEIEAAKSAEQLAGLVRDKREESSVWIRNKIRDNDSSMRRGHVLQGAA